MEKLVQEYNTSAFKLGVLGNSNPELKAVKNELELQINASTPEKMVSLDLKSGVKVRFSILYLAGSISPKTKV